MTTRHYKYMDAEFILESLYPDVVKVTHRNQVGYFGVNLDWSLQHPYSWSHTESLVHDNGLFGVNARGHTPEDALKELCNSMLINQSKEDASPFSLDDPKGGAQRALQNFLEESPD